jgi:hypothetical protein
METFPQGKREGVKDMEQARAAKAKMASQLAGVPEVNGIGIAMLEGGYGVKVNLRKESSTVIPEEIDGVPVIVDVIGEVEPL